jgi:hypothetical protein
MGTPAYMAPEQVLGREIDGRADLYSVGVVLYRLLSGRLPFNADTAISMVQMQISEAPTPISTFRPDLPNWCTAIVDRALAKSPSDRFQSAEEFRAALISAVTPQALGEMPTLSTPTPPGLSLDLELTVPHRTPTPMRTSSSIPTTPVLAASPARPATPVSSSTRPAVAPTPTPTNTPLPEKTTTLVLGRTHLMALAALLVIVASGIGILAFAAFRARSSAGSQAAATESVASTLPAPPAAVETPTTVPSPPPATVPPPAATPPVSANPTAPATQKALPTGGVTVGQPPATTGERGVATAGAGPLAAKTAGRGTTSGVLPGGSPIDPARGGRAANPKDVVSPTPTPTPPPAPAVPAAPLVTFNQVRMLVAEGERAREREGVLQIGDGRISIVAPGGSAPIMSLATSALSGIFYARSKQPKWRDASGQTVESKIDLGRMGFLRGERNWIILLSGGEPVILRIEDSALRTVLPALQERTGQTIQR